MTPTLSTRPRHAALRAAPAAMALAMLAACGGGDDDGTAPPVVGAYTVGGALSGLAAGRTVTLQNNAENDLQLSANGSFEFSTRLDHGVRYAVTIKNQPAGQRCAVSQGTGTATANVSDVQVRCENLAAATFTVGGSVTGLSGTGLVLQNNGRDDLSVASNGGFTFGTALAGGTAYAITVRTQPSGQSCTVRNGTGTVGSANVSTVDVSCATAAQGLPEGDWKQGQCSVVRPGVWGRVLWRIARQSDTRATAAQGVMTYATADCSGQGTIAGPLTDLGVFNFDRSGSTASATAFWSTWVTPSGITSRSVWTRKGAYLCVFGDSTPTVFPTAASAEAYADLIIANKACYTQN